MTITIGSTTFDNVFYDADVDVLYLHKGDPSSAVDFDESPESHAPRFDRDGNLAGMTIVGANAPSRVGRRDQDHFAGDRAC